MAFDAYLRFEPAIEGEATRKGFEKQLEILSFSLGVSNPATIGPGSSGAGSGRASLSSFHFMKATDKASPQLFQHCAAGTHFDKVFVKLNKAGGEESVTYLEYEFEECMIEAVSWSGTTLGGDDRPAEDVNVAYGKVTITYSPQAAKGDAQAQPYVGSWDVRTMTS